jgi:ribonuclease HI
MSERLSVEAVRARLERLVTELALIGELPGPDAPVKPGRYLLNTDAGVRRGEGAIGVVLCDPEDRLVAIQRGTIRPASVQEAEYRALISGLELALGRGVEKIRTYLDNQVVVDQIHKPETVKNASLKSLNAEVLGLLDRFPDQGRPASQKVCWVPRERNRVADALVRLQLGMKAVIG